MAEESADRVRSRAFARAGLMGNPSDGYGGRAIAFTFRDFRADVTCGRAEGSRIDESSRTDPLIAATQRTFDRWCSERELTLNGPTPTLDFETDIPYKVGLAGSSAIVTAAVRALMAFHGVQIPASDLPGLILSVETDELGIPGGLMDRAAQVYEGLMFMDLSRERLGRTGYGEYRTLPIESLPPLFIAFRAELAEGSEVVHGDLRRRFDDGEPLVLDAMRELGSLADQARDLIEADRGGEILPLMDQNLELRDRVAPLSDGNRALIRCGRELGASVKFAGSGGAVVGAYDGDPGRLSALRAAYDAAGAGFLVPDIA